MLLLPGTLLLLPGKDAEEPVPMLLPTPLDGGLDVPVPLLLLPLLLVAPPELPIMALEPTPPDEVAAEDDTGAPLEPAITDEAPPLEAAPEEVAALLPPDEEPEFPPSTTPPPSVPTMPPPSGSNVMFPLLEDASPGRATLFSGQPSNSRPPATISNCRPMRM